MSSYQKQWYGKTPVGWKEQKLKYLMRIKNGKEISVEMNQGDSSINVYGSGGVFKWTNNYLYHGESVLFGRKGTIGKPLFVNEAFWTVDTMYYTQFSKEANPKFFYYLMCIFPWDVITTQTALPSIVGTDIENFDCSVPDYPTQKAISTYLDVRIKGIDNLIKEKETLIGLLEEKRQAIITEAVTKGLSPNVKLKESGVEWIGEIPEHWMKSKLKYATSQIIDGTHHTPNYQNSGIPFLRVTDITKSKGKNINLEEVKFISEEEHQVLKKRCHPEIGDLLVSKNGTIGVPKVIDWDFEFSIFVSLCLIKLRKEKLNPNFCSYFFGSNLVDEQIASGSKKSTIMNLHLDKIKEFTIFLPPLEEQEMIVESLNGLVKEYDELIWDIQSQIEKLKDYRQSLIYEAVTGKIDVSDFELISK